MCVFSWFNIVVLPIPNYESVHHSTLGPVSSKMACFFENWKSGLQRIRLFKIVMAKPNGVKKHDIYLPNTCGKATGIRREEQNGHFTPGNRV